MTSASLVSLHHRNTEMSYTPMSDPRERDHQIRKSCSYVHDNTSHAVTLLCRETPHIRSFPLICISLEAGQTLNYDMYVLTLLKSYADAGQTLNYDMYVLTLWKSYADFHSGFGLHRPTPTNNAITNDCSKFLRLS